MVLKPFGSGNCAQDTRDPAPVLIRPATDADHPALEALAGLATRDLLGPFLSKEQRAATFAFTPLDPWLIEDGTYFVLEVNGKIRASGGWSWRGPMIHNPNRQYRPPESQSNGVARIRAMYTDPGHARKGFGRTILSVCELAARLAGVRRLELIATPVGELLYRACGFESVEIIDLDAPGGVIIPVTRMQKILSRKMRQPRDTEEASVSCNHSKWRN